MAAGRHTLVIEQGATLDQDFTWYTDRALTNPKNLTGATARAKVRGAGDVVLLDLSSADGEIILGGPAGTIQFNVDFNVTAALAVTNRARWDLEIFQDNKVRRLLAGPARVIEEQTR